MKKIIVILLSTLLLTGCYDYKELNTIAIVSATSIDYINDEYDNYDKSDNDDKYHNDNKFDEYEQYDNYDNYDQFDEYDDYDKYDEYERKILNGYEEKEQHRSLLAFMFICVLFFID